jgi:recombination protein RecR
MIYPSNLANVINYFRKFPGIGEKSAERLALFVINMSSEDVNSFAASMIDSKLNLHPCSICGHITDKEICDVCSDEKRNKNLICVLEDYKSVFAFERAGNFNGVYHVLNGLISPLNDVNPEDINIASLEKRIKDLDNPEIIIALKSSMEGDTTTLYIQKKLEKENVSISRLSYGIPMGAEIDFLDEITLDRALHDRKLISEK